MMLRRSLAFLLILSFLVVAATPTSAQGPKGPPDTAASTAVCDISTSLAGWFSGTVGYVYNRSANCSFDVGIASYKKYNELISDQTYVASSTAQIGPNATIMLTVAIPACASQIDVFWGSVILSFANGDRYGPRLLSALHTGGTNYCVAPTPTPVPPTATSVPPTTVPPTATSVPPTTVPPTATPATQGCTYTIGYWKTHSKTWPVNELTLGGVTYGKAQLVTILQTEPQGDATYILIHQLIGAKLNVAKGASARAVAATILSADAWLSAHPLGSNPGNPDRQIGIDDATTLDNYNNGMTGPGHCR